MKNLSNLKVAAAEVFLMSQSYTAAMRVGGLLSAALAGAPVMAAGGLINGFTNLNSLIQLGIGIMIAIGLMAGLGFVLGACMSMYKKYDRGNDEITWSKIGMQFFAGGLGMALGWVGIQIVETMGGSASDIGKSM